MNNKLIDLNNHLFMELERLGDESLKGEELKEEIGRANAISQVATKVVDNARLALDAEKAKYEKLGANSKMPKMLENS